MAASARSLLWLGSAMVVASFGVGYSGLQTVKADSTPFCAAYFHPVGGPEGTLLTLFPMAGRETDVTLPAGLTTSRLIAFGPDGKAMYVQENHPLDLTVGINKIEFKPARRSVVRGSVGLGTIWFLTVSQPSGRIFVSGVSGRGNGECGAFEIDPDAGTLRALRVGIYPDCGGAAGPISPDGKRLLSRQGKQLSILDLKTGALQTLGTGKRGSWSPDGRWIAASLGGGIVLIDATNPSRRRKLGASGVDGHLIWSPDSKHLLFTKSELRCAFTESFESLATVDVETGKRSVIKNSHCMVSSSNVGWIDPDAVR